MMSAKERKLLDARMQDLISERSTFDQQWRDIYDQFLPYRARWTSADFKRGEALSTTIINSTPLLARRYFVAGLIASVTSPSHKWYRLTTSDKELNALHDISSYLNEVEEIIREQLNKSGWYHVLAAGTYGDLGSIATAALFMEEDPVNVIRFEDLLVGEYYLDVNNINEVDTCFRVRTMTIRQMAQEFGYDALPAPTRHAYDKKEFGSKRDVIHAVFPNEELVIGRRDERGKPYLSRWWEKGSSVDSGFLRTGGYEEFPVLAPRLYARSGEGYGHGGPGWESVADCKALQHQELSLAKLIDKSADPPMRAHESLKNARASLMPGDVTYTTSASSGAFEPAMSVHPNSIVAVSNDISKKEQQIRAAWYVNLWLALIGDQRRQRATATEVEETKKETLIQLGPLLESLNTGLLEPAIERAYAILSRAGRLPEPPKELQGTQGSVKIEFISILHQAQRYTEIASIDELLRVVGGLIQIGKDDALDKIDSDAIIDELTEILGVKPDLVLSEDRVESIRQERLAQAQAQQQGQAMLAATQGLRNVGSADPSNVDAIAQMISPVAAAQGGAI